MSPWMGWRSCLSYMSLILTYQLKTVAACKHNVKQQIMKKAAFLKEDSLFSCLWTCWLCEGVHEALRTVSHERRREVVPWLSLHVFLMSRVLCCPGHAAESTEPPGKCSLGWVLGAGGAGRTPRAWGSGGRAGGDTDPVGITPQNGLGCPEPCQLFLRQTCVREEGSKHPGTAFQNDLSAFQEWRLAYFINERRVLVPFAFQVWINTHCIFPKNKPHVLLVMAELALIAL